MNQQLLPEEVLYHLELAMAEAKTLLPAGKTTASTERLLLSIAIDSYLLGLGHGRRDGLKTSEVEHALKSLKKEIPRP